MGVHSLDLPKSFDRSKRAEGILPMNEATNKPADPTLLQESFPTLAQLSYSCGSASEGSFLSQDATCRGLSFLLRTPYLECLGEEVVQTH